METRQGLDLDKDKTENMSRLTCSHVVEEQDKKDYSSLPQWSCHGLASLEVQTSRNQLWNKCINAERPPTNKSPCQYIYSLILLPSVANFLRERVN